MAQYESLPSPSSPPSVSMLQPISMVPEHKDFEESHGGINHMQSPMIQQQQQHLQPPQAQQEQYDQQALEQRIPAFQSRGGGDGSDEAMEVAIMDEVAEVEEEPRCSTPASSPYPYPSNGHQRHNSTSGRSRNSDPGVSTAAPPPPPPAVSSDEDDHYTLLQSWSGEVVFPVPAVICGNSDSSSTGSRRRSLPSMPKGMTLKNLGIKIASPLKGALNGAGNNNADPASNNRSPGNSFKGGKSGGGGAGSPGGQNLNTSHHSKASSVGASPARRRGVQGVPRNAVSVSSFSNTDFSPHVLLTWSLEKAHDGPIWAAKFSPGGKYLATAGEDGKILVWAVGGKFGGKGKGKGGGAGAVSGNGGSGSGSGAGAGSGARDPSSSAAGGTGGGGRRSSTMAVAPGMANDKVAAARAKKFSQRRVMKELNGQQSSFTQGGDGPAIGTEVKLLSSEPIQRFQEHTGDVIDLSWSPGPESNFLLSASLDKTVRLWHVSKPQSLQVFPHDDLVTSVDFHPVDDEYFVSAGLDKKLRLWSTTKRSVRAWAQAPEAVTAARFAPSLPGGGGVGGQTQATVVAGLIKGQVYFYKCSTPKGGAGGGTAGGVSSGASVASAASGMTSMGTGAPTLKYHTQILCRNRQGTHSEGRKVTGLSFRTISPGGITAAQLRERSYSDDAEDVGGGHQLPMDQMSAPATVSSPPRVVRVGSNTSSPGAGNAATTSSRRAHQQLLVTTNDSRLRVIGLDDYCVIHKYKGAANTTMQIKASYSESGNKIISGSEVGNVHVWDSSQDQYLGGTNIANHKSYDRSSTCASFVASTSKLAHLKPVVTCAVFAPTTSVEAALIASNLFPTLDSFDHINHDISSSMMVSCDYEGTIRVFLKKSTLDVLFYEAGPEGSKFRDMMR